LRKWKNNGRSQGSGNAKSRNSLQRPMIYDFSWKSRVLGTTFWRRNRESE